MSPDLAGLLDGPYFHTLCGQDADALDATLQVVERRFGGVLPRMKWLNFGGHHITCLGYDIPGREWCIHAAQEK